MIFDWREYLKLAHFLEHQDEVHCSRDAAFRSAVSRAYYAAFCYARNHARDHDGFVPTRSSEDHKHLRTFFRKTGQMEIAGSLEDLRQWRNACDYDDHIGDLLQNLQSALQSAKTVIDQLA